jgi:hypothetical protein
MNLYVIVEGRRTEPILYRKWIPQLLPGFYEISRVEDALDEGSGNTFYIIAGGGQPAYKNKICGAIKDCAAVNKHFHLIVCVDSEDATPEERIRENKEIIRNTLLEEKISTFPSSIIIADCCIETWLLGNTKIVKRNPERTQMRAYLEHYDVVTRDPEKMPIKPGDRTRAETHLNYLKEVFRERNMTYTKNHPGDASEAYYLKALVDRARGFRSDGSIHLKSFSTLLSLCDKLQS